MRISKIEIGSNKTFGIVFFIFFLIISFYPTLVHGESFRVWALIIGLIFLLLGMLKSQYLTPLNIAWYKLGLFLGRFVAPLIMALVFFSVVTPTGLIMRLFRKDILNLKKKNSKSYWIEKNNSNKNMKNQF